MIITRWILILLLAFPAIGLAETEPEFYLCSPYLEKTTVGDQTDEPPVVPCGTWS